MGRLKLMAAAASLAVLAGATTLPTAAGADIYSYVLFGNDTMGEVDLSTTHGADYAVDTLVGGASLVGLGEIGNQLYGESDDQLYWLSISGTTVTEHAFGGVQSADFIAFGSTTTGLYAIGANGDLYSIVASGVDRGMATDLGSLGLGALSRNDYMSLSSGSSDLYFTDETDGTDEELYKVTTSGIDAGQLTEEGTLTSDGTTALEVGGLADIGGDFYAGTDNGQAHGSHAADYLVSTAGCSPCTYNQDIIPDQGKGVGIIGMALGQPISSTAPPVPEPGEWTLMFAGVGAVGGMMRLRRRREALA